ncbi:YlbF family regulator [Thermohalobacter berrensis]|uniref:Uncharacterized protein n=1 Tax=Thermohalobacter berrensis TaxID=99594 RepID=A0A419TAY1_9FIRM|nr:YlbF family regulator [Thermohalobacter berrensis]RKD34607.1 hypothetical protein BET03_01920 [Thermohalobacter berrensis]
MNVYDEAHSLARAIKNSNEYKEYVRRQREVLKNTKLKEMVQDFRSKAMEIQMAQMGGKKVDEEKIEKFKKLEEVVTSNPVINEFFAAEMRFAQMMNDIYKILGDTLDVDLGVNDK